MTIQSSLWSCRYSLFIQKVQKFRYWKRVSLEKRDKRVLGLEVARNAIDRSQLTTVIFFPWAAQKSSLRTTRSFVPPPPSPRTLRLWIASEGRRGGGESVGVGGKGWDGDSFARGLSSLACSLPSFTLFSCKRPRDSGSGGVRFVVSLSQVVVEATSSTLCYTRKFDKTEQEKFRIAL